MMSKNLKLAVIGHVKQERLQDYKIQAYYSEAYFLSLTNDIILGQTQWPYPADQIHEHPSNEHLT